MILFETIYSRLLRAGYNTGNEMAIWGSITGTLSNQTDLVAALAAASAAAEAASDPVGSAAAAQAAAIAASDPVGSAAAAQAAAIAASDPAGSATAAQAAAIAASDPIGSAVKAASFGSIRYTYNVVLGDGFASYSAGQLFVSNTSQGQIVSTGLNFIVPGSVVALCAAGGDKWVVGVVASLSTGGSYTFNLANVMSGVPFAFGDDVILYHLSIGHWQEILRVAAAAQAAAIAASDPVGSAAAAQAAAIAASDPVGSATAAQAAAIAASDPAGSASAAQAAAIAASDPVGSAAAAQAAAEAYADGLLAGGYTGSGIFTNFTFVNGICTGAS